MARTVPANEKAIKALKSDNPKGERVSIEGSDGLFVSVTKHGPGSYWLRYWAGDKSRWKNLGSVDAVRLGQVQTTVTADRNAIVVDKRDLVDERHKAEAAGTFDDVFKSWIDKYAKQERKTWKRAVWHYEQYMKAALGDRLIADVKRKDIAELLDDIKENSRENAVKCREIISAMYSWAEDREICPHVARGIKLGRKSKPRQHPWTTDELGKFWLALDRMGDAPTAMALKLLVLSGKRLSEVCGAEIKELRLNGTLPTWTLPGDTDGKGGKTIWGRTKSGQQEIVPLSPLMLDLFKQAVAAAGQKSEHVFPCRDGATKFPHIDPRAVSRQRKRILDKLGIEDPPTTHDLRTTMNDGAIDLGIAAEVRRKMLGHSPSSDDISARVYSAHELLEQRRSALEAWEKRVLEIAHGKPTAPVSNDTWWPT